MKAALGKERERKPAEKHERAAPAKKPESEGHPHEWETPGSIEQFERRSREDIVGFDE